MSVYKLYSSSVQKYNWSKQIVCTTTLDENATAQSKEENFTSTLSIIGTFYKNIERKAKPSILETKPKIEMKPKAKQKDPGQSKCTGIVDNPQVKRGRPNSPMANPKKKYWRHNS